MGEKISNYWSRFLKVLGITDTKKKCYTTKKIDFILIAYLLLLCSIAIFFVVKTSTDSKSAFPFLFLIPTIIGGIFFYFFLPIKFLNFIISRLILFLYLRKIRKNTPSKTVIVAGKSEYKSPNYWLSPNYDLDLIFLLEYLKLKGEDFSIYKIVDIDILDEIMSNNNISTVYLYGHGRRHAFTIDSSTTVDYCRYNDPRYRKNYVYQIHCNSHKGTSLVEYVVDERNREECLPEHGYISSLTIKRMFIDKIIQNKSYGKFMRSIARIWYNFLGSIGIFISIVIWILMILIFVKIAG